MKHHYNTTNLEGLELDKAESEAIKQEKRILAIIRESKGGLPNSVICTIHAVRHGIVLKQVSCSRALRNMTVSEKLIKGDKSEQILVDGRKVYVWTINNDSK